LNDRYGLTPFTDNASPTINAIVPLQKKIMKPYPLEDGVPVVDGQVTIRINAKDSLPTGLGSNTVGVYWVGYRVMNAAGSVVSPKEKEGYGIDFSKIAGYTLGTIYHVMASSESNYEYLATNSRGQFSPPQERWWDTTLVPDGKYTIEGLVSDITGNGAIRTQSVIVRNMFSLNVIVDPARGRVTSPSVIDCPGDCSEFYPKLKNTVVNLTAIPKSGFIFQEWSGACSGSGPCSVTMDKDKTVTALFRKAQIFSLSVNTAGSGSGTTQISGTPCGTNCTNLYEENPIVPRTLTLTAIPMVGSVFSKWSGDSDCTDGSVTMNYSKTCTAIFNKLFALTMTIQGAGSGTITSRPSGISCAPYCTINHPDGTSVTLTANAGSRSIFAGWSGDCSGGNTSITIAMKANISCIANFAASPPISVLLVIDKSGSMAGTFLDNTKKTAKAFIDKLGGGDKVGVITFPAIQTISEFTTDFASVKKKIDTISADGGTPLYDSIIAGVDKIVKEVGYSVGRGAMVVLSDGSDNASTATIQNVINKINNNPQIKSFFIFAEHVDSSPGVDSANSPYVLVRYHCSRDSRATPKCEDYMQTSNIQYMIEKYSYYKYNVKDYFFSINGPYVCAPHSFNSWTDCFDFEYAHFIGYTPPAGSSPLSDNPLKFIGDKTGSPYYNSVKTNDLNDIYLSIANQLNR